LVLLLDVVARSDVSPLPPNWIDGVKGLLAAADDAVLRTAIAAAAAARHAEVDKSLNQIIFASGRTLDLRLAAMAAVMPRRTSLSVFDFEFLRGALAAESPLDRLTAARLLTDIKLADDQLAALLTTLKSVDPGIRPVIEAAFKSAGPAIQERIRQEGLFASSSAAPGSTADAQRLALIDQQLPEGGALSGKQVFFGRRAACSACHRVGSEGGKIGPDLTKVGERRNQRDLLEAVVFPSSSIARGFESYAIRTVEGQSLTGLVVRETADSLFLRTADQREIRLRRDSIEAMKPSTVSIMPAGLENTMNRQELADLLAYLRSLK
jgi:putative heme-binding domain-containing protein